MFYYPLDNALDTALSRVPQMVLLRGHETGYYSNPPQHKKTPTVPHQQTNSRAARQARVRIGTEAHTPALADSNLPTRGVLSHHASQKHPLDSRKTPDRRRSRLPAQFQSAFLPVGENGAQPGPGTRADQPGGVTVTRNRPTCPARHKTDTRPRGTRHRLLHRSFTRPGTTTPAPTHGPLSNKPARLRDHQPATNPPSATGMLTKGQKGQTIVPRRAGRTGAIRQPPRHTVSVGKFLS